MESKRIVLPLAGGEDRGTEPLVLGERLATSRNTIITREGAVEKRTAFVELAGSYTESRIAALKDVPVLFGTRVRVGLSAAAATAYGAPIKATMDEAWQTAKADLYDAYLLTTVNGTGDNPEHVDIGGDPSNGWVAVALSYSAQIYIAVIDTENKVLLAERWASVTGSPAVHIVTSANGDTWALYVDQSTFEVMGSTITATAVSAPSSLYSSNPSSADYDHIYDCCALDGDNIAFVFVDSTPQWRALVIDASDGSVDADDTWAITEDAVRVGVFRYDTNTFAVAMAEGNDPGSSTFSHIFCRGYTSALVSDFSVTVESPVLESTPWICYAIGGIARSATELSLYYTMGRGDDNPPPGVGYERRIAQWQRWSIRTCDVEDSGGWAAGTPEWWMFSARQLSRPFLDSTDDPAMLVGHIPRVDSLAPSASVIWPFSGAEVRTQLGSAFVVRDITGSTYWRPMATAKLAHDRAWLPLDRDWSLTSILGYERQLSHVLENGDEVMFAIALQAAAESRRVISRRRTGAYDTTYYDVIAGERGGGLGVGVLDQSPAELPRIVEGRDWLLVPGGLPSEFDGRRFYEQGFQVYPEDITVRRVEHSHGASDTVNLVTGTAYPLSAGSSQADADLLANTLKSTYEAHRVNISGTLPEAVHWDEDDSNAISAADSTDLASCILLANNLKAKFNLHFVDNGSHYYPDENTSVDTDDAVSLFSEVYPLLNELYDDYNAHRVLHGSGYVQGTVRYMVVPHWVDGAGNSHWGAPVVSEQISTDDYGWAIRVDIATLQLTRRDDVEFFVYRTKDGPGPSFYFVGSVANNRSVETVTVSDSIADDDLTGGGPYNAGNVIEHVAPPPHRVSTVWQGRHWVLPRDCETWQAWYSQRAQERGDYGHNEVFQVWFDPSGGRVTAFVPLGDRLLIFKEDRILAVDGQGLDATGQGMGYAEPSLIASEVGCVDARTVVQTPAGVMFLSLTGIMLIDRALQVHPVGQPVRYYTDTQTIACGVALPERDCAIWLCGSGEYALVYNWRFGRWMTWSQPDATDACVVDGKLWALSVSRSGKVVKEDRTAYLDWGDTFVQMLLRTGWLHPAGPQGFGRIVRLGLIGYNAVDHILKVTLRYNGDPYDKDEMYLDSSTLENFDEAAHYGDDLGSGYERQAYLLQFLGSKKRMTSLQIEVCDVTAIP